MKLFLIGLATMAVTATAAQAQDIDWTQVTLDGYEVPLAYENDEGEVIRSGYTFRTKGTQAMQADDFENPAMWRVDEGEVAWATPAGSEGKSCADCHGDAAESMATTGTEFPKVNADGELLGLEHQINKCRTEQMGAEAFKWESQDMLTMTVYVRHQSRGKPVNVQIDGPAAEHYAKGEELYNKRIGQLDMACKHCHQDYYGNYIRADFLSQGQSNGFPTYRQKWGKVGSIHRRIRGCMDNIRAKKYPYGSYENTVLELYLANRGKGLPVETPAVRN